MKKVLEDKQGKKAKRIRGFGYNLLIIIGILLVVFSAYNLIKIFSDYKSSNDIYEKIENQCVEKNKEQEAPWYDMIRVDFANLKAKNEEVVGWIFFENEDISYPIMYSGDDEYYLRRTFEGTDAIAGSIFLEGENNTDFNDYHSIIYGHNMKNLSMFGKLKFYNRDEKYYDTHQFFQILTDECIYRYQVFAYETVDDNSFIYSVPFAADDNFQTFILKIKQISQKDTGIEVSKDNKIITLSTCSTNGDQYRFVVHAVRVDTYDKEKDNEE